MNPSDQLKAQIRTWWPAIVGGLAGLLVTWLAQKVGVTVNSNVVMVAVSTVLIGLIYTVGRRLEKSTNSFAAAVGRWLVSMGRDLGQPTYVQNGETKPLAGPPPSEPAKW